MKFKIEEKIFKDYPGLYAGVVLVHGLDNTSDNPEIVQLLQRAQSQAREKYANLDVVQHPYIIPWREAYQKFGAKPRDYRCSSEALLRMVLKGRDIRHINKLVDLYNYISLKYTLTLGGEDLDKMAGDLVLDYADGNEAFVPLGENANDPPLPGEVIYKDDKGVICRRWNWREGDRTKLGETTKNAVLVVEGLPPIERNTIEEATRELARLVENHCAGKVKVEFLDEDKQEMEIS